MATPSSSPTRKNLLRNLLNICVLNKLKRNKSNYLLHFMGILGGDNLLDDVLIYGFLLGGDFVLLASTLTMTRDYQLFTARLLTNFALLAMHGRPSFRPTPMMVLMRASSFTASLSRSRSTRCIRRTYLNLPPV